MSCSGDDDRTNFDDASTAAITVGTPPFTSTFRPESPLSAFKGVAPNGTWTLRIYDVSFQDSGALQCWSLAIIPRFDNITPLAIPDASTVESPLTTLAFKA